MSSIQTGIELNDQFTSVMYGIINSVNLVTSSVEEMAQTMNTDIDTSSLEGARDEINQVSAALNEMQQAAQNQISPNITPPNIGDNNGQVINVDVNPVLPDPLVENPEAVPLEVQPNAPPEAVEVPVQWQSDNMEVFTGTGIERFQQEVQSANSMLEQLSSTQDSIARQAYNTNILPPEAARDLNSLAVRIDSVRDRIQQIENNKVNMGTDIANSQLEQLRSQLNQAVQQQNELNTAMQNMDVSAANSAYLQLSSTVSNTERYIRDNVDEQGQFNQQIQEGTQEANGLMDTIKSAIAAYVSIQSVGKALNISDELASTTARLNLMNDGLQSTQELENMIYIAAQNSRGSFSDMASSVAKLGNLAGDAFNSSTEIVAFAEQLNKQMKLSGASTQEASSAMLQLTQSLAKGTLNGDELTSVMENGSMVVQTIADYMGVAQGEIKELAAEGQITSDIIIAAMLGATDETNAAFESLPMTWTDAWQKIKNGALIAFQPVLQRINEIANSEAFQILVDGVIEAMAILSNVVLNIFDFVGSVGNFIADNWSIISPIIYGIAAALAVYYGWQLLCAAATGMMQLAQTALNAVMSANPVMLVVLGIIALIAVIFAVCNAIAKMTGIANTGFGVMTGGVNVVIQFFKNLGLEVANIALGIGEAIAAVASNMMTAFNNAICNVQSWFYNLLSTALVVIAGICAALNKLPFVEFDYSGITSAAGDYAAKAAEAAGNKEDYTSISDAFNQGMSTFDTFQDGWASDAFDAGAAWGDGIADKVSNFSLSDLFGRVEIPNEQDYTPQFEGIGDNLSNIADDTGAMKDGMDVTEEDLKYLRDIAEQDAINKFTTAEIHIDQSGMQNTINNGMDLDGVITALNDGMGEAIEIITEGVHE